jgi:DNA-directed RNA polymerase specialized sigma24 family protein
MTAIAWTATQVELPQQHDSQSDPQLIVALDAGDADAFEVLYFRYRDWVVNLARRFTGSEDLALDVMQETFLYLLRKFPGFRLTANLKTFLYPAVKNLSIAARRKAARVQSTEAEQQLIEQTPAPESLAIAQWLTRLEWRWRGGSARRRVDCRPSSEAGEGRAVVSWRATVAQTGSLLYPRFATCGNLTAERRPADGKSAIRQSPTLRHGPMLVVLLSLALSGGLGAQPSTTNTPICFRAMDIFVDSKEKPLAAYQLEFTAANGNPKIVGIEGGEHRAFARPPFYDPRAMQHQRVIIAAFSTETSDKLPKGRTRVATIHVQTKGAFEPGFELRLQAAADAGGNKIAADSRVEERKAK